MPGTADVDSAEILFFDQSVEVGVGKALAGVRTPMAEQARLYVLQSKRSRSIGLALRYSIPRHK
jgi:hypothetical protein